MRTILLMFLISAIALAQTGTEGSILGLVKDSSGAVVPGASVTVTNVETGMSSSAVTDGNGFFQVLALPRGRYSVSVSAPHFFAWRLSATELIAGEATRIAPVLTVADVKEEVTVQGCT